ncbi:carboxypeptidase-like regulatory domain-containing protein [Taibaiella soli]|uniref:Carboxypeptidase-like regulatory domain-containing protein n=1 Tax=Taibaiella soli TaxID=1649169 RepID=A0A2W2B8P8_9BACT|nr:carboxypeptidase-like regulatory domain-containing protein [Taibaiella soli]PZF72659.1 hypothetical protein DN068_12400 [Taibaiella soli]
MKRHVLIVFLLLVVGVVNAQTWTGVITDDNTKLPLGGVTVYNRSSKELSTSEINGAYAIKAAAGDTVIFVLRGYMLEKRTGALLEKSGNVLLMPTAHMLDEVVIESPYLKYRRDSAEERLIYHKTIKDARQRPKFDGSSGIAINGGFTWLANHISGRSKKYKHFVGMVKNDEQAKYVSIVYNQDKVIALTHASDSLAAIFIASTPMPYDFAHTASSLELSMWIREHFREFCKPKPVGITRPFAQ